MAEVLHYWRERGDDNNRHDNEREVFLYKRQVAEKVTSVDKQSNPERAADDVI